MVKSRGTSGSEGGSNKSSCCVSPVSSFLVLRPVCWSPAGAVSVQWGRLPRRGLFGDRVQSWIWTMVSWSHGPLSLFPLCLPSPNSPWVYVIRPKWAAICTPAVWFCPAQGTSLPHREAAPGKEQGGWGLLPDHEGDSVRDHSPPEKPAKKFTGVLCFGSFRGKKVLLAPKARLDYPASQ